MDLLGYLWPIYDLIIGKVPSNEDLAMEELCQRFPLIAQKILNHVDNETLINFKEAGRNNDDFLRKERFYWIRIIQRYNCLFGKLHDVWKKVVRKTPIEIIKELAVALHKFPKRVCRGIENEKLSADKQISPLEFVQKMEKHWHPLFISGACGSVNLCNHIIQKAGVTDPILDPHKRCEEITPLVFAAIVGDVDVFEFLIEKAEDKNPILRKDRKWTLLHNLAAKGNLEMCRVMVKKVDDKCPQDFSGQTPYYIAASYLKDKSPKDPAFWSLASSSGHLEVCRLFLETCFEDGVRTPFQLAAWNGHLSVVNERQNIPLREEYEEI
jgi:hypothetical protein